MHFLTASLSLVCDVRALFCPLEPLQTAPCHPVAYRSVSDVCQGLSATCTVLIPKQEGKECAFGEKSIQRTETRGEANTNS